MQQKPVHAETQCIKQLK